MSSVLPKIFLTIFNVAIVAFGVYYIYFAQYFNEKSSDNPCLRTSVTSIQWIGVISLALAGVGIAGAWFKLRTLLSLYVWAMFASASVAAVIFVFVWAMMPELAAEKTYSSTAEHGVWLSEYKPALQRALANDKDMFVVRKCFADVHICRSKGSQTQATKVDFIRVGCCFPPKRCELEQDSSGRWVAPGTGFNSSDNECVAWSNDGESCYECDSCKAAFLANFQDQWEKRTLTHVACVFMLILTSVVAYYTYVEDYGVGDAKITRRDKPISFPV